MSTDSVGLHTAHAQRIVRSAPVEPVAVGAAEAGSARSECLEFVRFCYRRRPVSWPALYDEMCAVAARGAFNGLGYGELAERGICFSLTELPRLAELTEQVMLEARSSHEPPRSDSRLPVRLSVAQASS